MHWMVEFCPSPRAADFGSDRTGAVSGSFGADVESGSWGFGAAASHGLHRGMGNSDGLGLRICRFSQPNERIGDGDGAGRGVVGDRGPTGPGGEEVDVVK